MSYHFITNTNSVHLPIEVSIIDSTNLPDSAGEIKYSLVVMKCYINIRNTEAIRYQMFTFKLLLDSLMDWLLSDCAGPATFLPVSPHNHVMTISLPQEEGMKYLTLMLLVANFANTKFCKKTE